jgi:signal transduction histidine kinase
MQAPAAIAPAHVARARADQVALAYAGLPRTTISMLLGAALLAIAMRGATSPATIAVWVALVVLNQLARWRLVVAWRRARPGTDAVLRWGRYWAAGSTVAGALWGGAAVAMYPSSSEHQALLIVCLFGVVLGGLNLTAIWRPSFYGFVLTALLPLIARVAWVGDAVHVDTALVMSVVLGFVLAFGHRVNDVLTQAMAMRYENVDLIDELRAQTRAALEARSAAEAANRAKSQLLAAASHDLRQPLHAAGLFVAALATRAIDADVRALIGRVQGALDALESQFGQLIDLSRLEAGALKAERTRVALSPLFRSLVDEFHPQAELKGIRLACVPTRLAIDTDPSLFTRVLRNLVANAVRYTRAGGVVIGARRRGERVVVEVADTGPGIAPEHRARIFEEFYQIRAAGPASPNGHGMGLGLAIVRRLARLLGHEITLTSRPGCGSRFGVAAPRVTGAGMPLPRETPNLPAAGGALAGSTVAVVDDDASSVDAMRMLFAAWGATVAGGRDAEDALAELARLSRCPDLIVADLRLERDASGLDAVAALRHEIGEPVPALLVSGDTSLSAAQAVRAAGFALLPKPVVPDALAAAAAALIAGGRRA